GSYYNLGVSLNELGKRKCSLAIFDKALKIKPNYIEIYNNIGVILSELGKNSASRESFQKAIILRPNHEKTYSNLGNNFYAIKDYETALKLHHKTIIMNPNHYTSFNNLGSTFVKIEKLEAAKSSFFKTIELNPKYIEAYHNLAKVLIDEGNYKAAISLYSKAILLKPEDVNSYYDLSKIFHKLGYLKKSIRYGKKTISIDPNNTEAFYLLGLVFYKLQCFDEARRYFSLNGDELSESWILRCLYEQDEKELFYNQLDSLLNNGHCNAMIGAVGCRANIRYNVIRENSFCTDPLSYVVSKNLSKQYDFQKTFIDPVQVILEDDTINYRGQGLLKNGGQTDGNLFLLKQHLTKNIQKAIRKEIAQYRDKFRDSEEKFIKYWPADYNLTSWLIQMKSGGELGAHLHEFGWISGSIYINVPNSTIANSGNLVTCLEEEKFKIDSKLYPEKIIDVQTGSICLFPSSLLHYTIPFESEEERIVLAFDVIPTSPQTISAK
ncbi:tetratricopeptide repeat protein, partial [Rhodospirillaceae bacterium]|nr:tetratricopeptide repeat protein [Rhodospirillaceae bacterium]